MELHDLFPAPGSRKGRKRVGRGHGSGHGGQLPLYMRLPKLGGFTNRNRVEYAVVNLGRLNDLFEDGDVVTAETLEEKGAIRSALKAPVKILGDGEITKKLTVKVDKVSKSAQAKIEAAGGTVG